MSSIVVNKDTDSLTNVVKAALHTWGNPSKRLLPQPTQFGWNLDSGIVVKYL